MDKKNVYQIVTDRIIKNLETAGNWQKLWQIQQPMSIGGHCYQGINHLLLSNSGYSSPVWGTFKQVKDNGGTVKKGEKSTIVVFWKVFVNEIENNGETETEKRFMLRYYNVFNSEQCEFTESETGQAKINKLAAVSENLTNERKQSAEDIVNNWYDKPEIRFGQFNPCYVPALDQVRMPEIKSFKTSGAYYDALFHELTHSTGHKNRLNRDLSILGGIDKHEYSKEELVAEIGAAYLCNIAGIDSEIDNQTAYIKGWLSKLQDNPTWITWAASRAQKAAQLITNNVAAEVTEAA